MSEKNTTTAIDPADPRFKGLAEAEAGMRARNGGEVATLERYPDLAPRYHALMDTVPDAGADGAAALIDRLLEANTAEEFNSIWESEGLRDYLGQQVRVMSVKKSPSRKKGGLPYFLIMTIADGESGETKIITTGAVAPSLTLAKLQQNGFMPVDIMAYEVTQQEGMEGAPVNVKVIRVTQPKA